MSNQKRANMLTEQQRHFLEAARVARFATADVDRQPHVVPICYALVEKNVYFTVDEKPKKQPGSRLKRLQNLIVNPKIALIIDHYEEDWDRLGWVMIRGRADILEAGTEHDLAQARLRARYPQLVPMQIDLLPVIAIRIEHVSSWGCLDRP
jgi:PPOX class probable F420-dependent enzyme